MAGARRTVVSGARIFDGDRPPGIGGVVIENGVVAQAVLGADGPADGDPLVDITAIRDISRIRYAGPAQLSAKENR
jgi:hypothetical protein